MNRIQFGKGWGCLFLLVACLMAESVAWAGDAMVLPKGTSQVGVRSEFYLPFHERYDQDGDVEDLAHDYNTTINSNIFPPLQNIELGFGMDPSTANVGGSKVDIKITRTISELTYRYGVTDKLTVGMNVPYWITHVDAGFNIDTSHATVGFNPGGLEDLPPPNIAPLIPVDLGGVRNDTAMTNLMQDQLKSLYGYKKIEDWDDSSLGDIDLGARYQYLNTEDFRFAFTGGFRLPTGKTDDPDNLMDAPLGGGCYTIIFLSNHDYVGIKDLVLDVGLKYEWLLPKRATLRIPESVDLPLAMDKERVDVDQGDYVEVELTAEYKIAEGFSMSALYQYGNKFKDDVSGHKFNSYSSVEDETDMVTHIYIVEARYSTIPLFAKKQFPFPMDMSIAYRNRFAGENNAPNSQYIAGQVRVYF